MLQEKSTYTEIKTEECIRALANQYMNSPKFLSYKPKTQEFYAQSINHFLKYTDKMDLQHITQITREELKIYIESCNKTKTIYRRIAAINGFFVWTLKIEPENYQKNPFSQIMIDRQSGSNQVTFPKFPIRNF